MKDIFLYNTLSHTVEKFVPNIAGKVSLYCCGITVYDHCHIGHGRIFVITDLLFRLFQNEGYLCQWIRNITDIDDKILNRAEERQIAWDVLAQTYIHSMHTICTQLNCLPIPCEPKATDSIPQMITMIESLLKKNHAYCIDNEVFFAVETFPSYGTLSGQDGQALEAGQRVAIAHHKRHPQDFTLWKPSHDTQVGWSSPWGRGRPGWHIECSAMIAQYVSGSLDFHMGGMDLKFPHHENERAQSQCCYSHPLSTSWLHVGFVTVDGEKMSKSLNNFQYLSEFIDAVSPTVTRYLYLATHYRQPISLSEAAIESARGSLGSLSQLLGPYQHHWIAAQTLHVDCAHPLELTSATEAEACATKRPSHSSLPVDFYQASSSLMNDEVFQTLMTPCREDLNIPQAIAICHQYAKALPQLERAQAVSQAYTILYWGSHILGIDLCALYSPIESMDQAPLHIQELAFARTQARANKDYQRADLLRQEALALGYELMDTASGMLFRVLR